MRSNSKKKQKKKKAMTSKRLEDMINRLKKLKMKGEKQCQEYQLYTEIER